MSTRRTIGVATFALSVVGSAALVATLDGAGVGEFLFFAVLLWFAVTVLRLVIDGGRRAWMEARQARSLASTPPEEVARRAVVEERVRLAADIEAVVRVSVTKMGEHAREAADEWDRDPTDALVGVQDEGRRAATELRRMLGLLREAEQSEQRAPTTTARETGPVGRTDIVLGVAAVVLSIAERNYPELPESMHTTTSAVLTGLAAATLTLRRRAPVLAAGICGALFLTGALTANPLSSGFWILLGPAWLAWTAMASRTWSGVAGTAALVGGITVNLAWYDAINLPLSLVIIGLAAIGGTLVGWSNTRRVTAHEQVIRRTADLDAAAGDAVRGERVAVARDLHDVVSHAIAVMVMQAGAAQALYGHDRHRARAALVAVQQTARETLQELDRLVAAIGAGTMGAALVATGAVEHDSNDLNALVERMRGAGLRINLDLNCPLSGSVGAVVYRIVQESLTNAARHAPGAKVIVTVRTEGDEITVDVVDDGPGAASSSRRGYGLVGIAERVERLGGQLTTGPASRDTGFRVCARLPAVGAVST